VKEETKLFLYKNAPSALAECPASVVSDRYLFVPSIPIIERLENMGWELSSAKETRTSRYDFEGFNRHMLRFRNSNNVFLPGITPEFILINGHNARVKLAFAFGVHVHICSNGLITGMEEGFVKYHLKYNMSDIYDGIIRVMSRVSITKDIINKMNDIELTKNEQGVFALNAAKLRWNEEQLPRYKYEELLNVKREEDNFNSLWKVYNRVQEGLIKGGIRYEMRNADRSYYDNTRPINQIDREVSINIGLWNLACQYIK